MLPLFAWGKLITYYSVRIQTMKNISKFQKQLLAWYQVAKRDLPWRQTRDPYKILVSEIMLQQTQVDTVIPYYERWIKHFPDFYKLAAAKETEVLKLWQGLGYYRRAKMLHRNAQEICAQHAGQLPKDTPSLLSLPGIGRYTAGAVASIAFGVKTPLLDGNVIRILTRIFLISKNVADKKTIEQLWGISKNILPDKNVGDFNQALMELGATICFPRNPNCAQCPVSKLCAAHQTGKEEFFPVKAPAQKITKLNHYAFLLRDKNNRLLVKKQKAGERWADLWTLPHFEKLEEGLKNFKIKNENLKKIRTDKHGFTRYQITLNTYVATHTLKSVAKESNYVWMTKSQVKHSTFPAVYQKIITETSQNDI